MANWTCIWLHNLQIRKFDSKIQLKCLSSSKCVTVARNWRLWSLLILQCCSSSNGNNRSARKYFLYGSHCYDGIDNNVMYVFPEEESFTMVPITPALATFVQVDIKHLSNSLDLFVHYWK